MTIPKVGDIIRGISADIRGCEAEIVEIRPHGQVLKLTKLGTEDFHNIREGYKVGDFLRNEENGELRVVDWFVNDCFVIIGHKARTLMDLKL
jgi:hypothetical protein